MDDKSKNEFNRGYSSGVADSFMMIGILGTAFSMFMAAVGFKYYLDANQERK